MGISIGELIKTERKQKGLTQKQLGDLCGMADSAIRRYESNRVTPNFYNLNKIFEALDIKDYNMLAISRKYYETEKADNEKKGIDKEGQLFLLTTDSLEVSKDILLKFFNELNIEGQREAIKLLYILHSVPEYTEPDDLPFD